MYKGRKETVVSLSELINLVESVPGRLSEFWRDRHKDLWNLRCHIPYFIDEIRVAKEISKVTGLEPGKGPVFQTVLPTGFPCRKLSGFRWG